MPEILFRNGQMYCIISAGEKKKRLNILMKSRRSGKKYLKNKLETDEMTYNLCDLIKEADKSTEKRMYFGKSDEISEFGINCLN